MLERLAPKGAPAAAIAAVIALWPAHAPPLTRTISSVTIRRPGVDRTFIPSAIIPVSNAEPLANLTVKGSLLDLSTGADVVNPSGSIVSGSRADILRRSGGANTEIDISIFGLTGQPAGEYRVRIHYAVEASGPDVVRIRLLERGRVTSITRDSNPQVMGGVYTPTNQTSTFRVSGSGLSVATIDSSRVAGLSYTLVSRSAASLVFTLRPTQPVRFTISGSDFYDANLGHPPTTSDENEMRVRYEGFASEEVFAAAAPTVTSISPQPATGLGQITLNGSKLVGGGVGLSEVRFGHRYASGTSSIASGLARSASSASFPGAYDIASGTLELRFGPEESLRPNFSTVPPSFTMSVPFTAAYAPALDDIIATAEQATIAGVRVLRAGTVTFIGKYLFTPAPATGPGMILATRVASISPVVKLGATPATVVATRYVAPTTTAGGRDSVHVTLADPADNIAGQFHVETEAGSATSPTTFVLATRPRVAVVTELANEASGGRQVLDQTLQRGREYLLSGTALSVKNGAQLLRAGTVRVGSRAMAMQSTPDPAAQLRFLVPQDATTGTLVVSTLGGDASLGEYKVTDASPGSVPTPRPKSLTFVPASVAAGVSATGVVTLDNPGASVPGFTIALRSSDPAVAAVPATLSVSGTIGQFVITTSTVSAPQAIRVAVTSGGETQTQTITVTPPVPTSLALNAIDVVAGATVQGTLTFTAPAAPATNATLSSTDPAAPVPATVPVNGNTAGFSIVTTEAPAPRTVTISGSANGVTKTATVTVTPLKILALSSSRATIRNGETATLTVTVNRGPSSDQALTVASSQPSLVQFDAATLGLGAGQTSGTIGLRVIAAPTAPTVVAITVSRSVVTAGFGTITTSIARGVTVNP